MGKIMRGGIEYTGGGSGGSGGGGAIDIKTIINLIYPINSVYYTTNVDFRPSNTFGGSWELLPEGYIKNIAAAAVGGSNSSGSTILTAEQSGLPAHTHTIASSGAHAHTVPNHTHSIPQQTIASGGAHTHKYQKYDKDVAKGTDRHRIWSGGESIGTNSLFGQNSGEHTHVLAAHNTNSSGTCTIASSGSHTHTASSNTAINATKGHTHSIEPIYTRVYAWKRIA